MVALVILRTGLILVLLLAPRPFTATVDRADPDQTIAVHAHDHWTHVRVSSADAASLPVRWGPDTAELVNRLATGQFVRVSPSWVDPCGRVIGTITLPDGRDLGREIIKRRS